jgi:hypothetical protein
MKKIRQILGWVDDNLLKILLTIYIFFIPLYPKLPLIDIEYTYIYIRIEDFFTALIYLIFFIQLIRKKVRINWKDFWFFALFWLAVFASYFYGFYYLKTIPVNYIGLLHSLRRIEYMGIFFVAYSQIKSKKDFFYYLNLMFITLFFVCIYGLGQKFFGWPAVQTMNPEYARGYLLYLTPEARISSTFSGHYDLASYLIFLMPLIVSYYFLTLRWRYFLLFVFALINLIFTASRISYIGYLLSIFSLLILLRQWKIFILVLILTLIFTFANQNLTSRLKRTFQVKRILVDQKTGAVYIPQKITTKELPAGSFYIPLKNQQQITNDNLESFKKKIVQEKKLQATQSGQTIDTASLEANLKAVNTVVSDISFATRLQVEWPRAIAAFKRSPFFGYGPSALTEATDNDYLRWLGETGLFGALSFILIIIRILNKFFQTGKVWLLKTKKYNETILYLGMFFAIAALMINATYIDVFEASKVAFTFWLIVGLFKGYLDLKEKKYETTV